jgi:16S rRNA processing protein RimM
LTLVTAGRVGRAHGLDGSFYVDGPSHDLPAGATVVVRGRATQVERRAGTRERPLIRLAGVDDPHALGGEPLLIEEDLAEGEWLASELVGCEVPELGRVRRVLDGPSCSLLELEDGTLVPFVSDAVPAVDTAAGRIEVDRDFLEGPEG